MEEATKPIKLRLSQANYLWLHKQRNNNGFMLNRMALKSSNRAIVLCKQKSPRLLIGIDSSFILIKSQGNTSMNRFTTSSK